MDEIKSIECRFALLLEKRDKDNNELHLIKENIVYKDGTKKPNVRLIKNFKRSFYVTDPKYRVHKDKKEYEDVNKLIKFDTLQSEIEQNVARALGQYSSNNLRMLSNSPYLYGSDIKSTAIIKQMYNEKYPDIKSFYSIATLDIESSMKKGDNFSFNTVRDIIIITICFEKNIFTTIYKPFIDGIKDFDFLLKEKYKKYLKDHVDIDSYNFEYKICNTQIEVITSIFDKLHEWKPDFLSIWNIDYDINEIAKVLEYHGVDPKDVFSDPTIPKECRYYRFKKGKVQKVTASGKFSPISPANQWHTVYTPSSFYIIDSMCTYRRNRLAKPEEQSYSLDAILNKELGLRKLKFAEADGYTGGEWHELMQSEYPVEYIIYNIFDSLSLIELEKKTKDLSVSLPLFCGISDFADYDSQPRRLADEFHFLYLEDNKVICSTGKDMKTELDKKLMSLKGLIVNLAAYLITNEGLANIKEDPNLNTNIRILSYDLDISAAYPSTQIASNVSKETTITEIMSIDKIDPYVSKMENINLFSGPVNALEYCQIMFNFPDLKKLLESYNSKC